jgi:hypothetical protein
MQVLGRRAGSTADERLMWMPGDELVAQPHILTNHANTIEAQPADVWPWLTQMGWHLGGFYTPEWVDRLLFPQNWPSLDHLDPALLRSLEVGDTIPDVPPARPSLSWRRSTPHPRWCCARRRTCQQPGGKGSALTSIGHGASGSPNSLAAELGCSSGSAAEPRPDG